MRSRYLVRATILALLACLYGALTQKYRAYDIDNPWFLSFSYNACNEGIQTDEFQRVRFPGGMDGVHLFGKGAAGVQCLVMNRAGWTPRAIVGLNLFFGIGALWLLWSFLIRAGYREPWVAAFILLLGVTEPMVSMMEKARYEFFAFFLLCLAFWLGGQGLESLSSFVALFSVETEPAAIIVPTVVVLWLAARTTNRKFLALKVCVAAAVSVALYVLMHPGAIHEMAAAPASSMSFPIGGTLLTYFVERRRHLPELLLILMGAVVYWRHRRDIADRTPVWMAMAASAILFLLHPTAAYMVFAMPFILWPTLEAYDRSRRLKWLPAGLFVFLLAGYGYLYKTNIHEGFGVEEFSAVRRQIDAYANSAGIPGEQIRVVGDYSLWFAHPRHYRAISSPESLQQADLYLCFDGPLERNGLSALTSMWCPERKTLVRMREVSSIELKDHLLRIFAPER